MAHTYKLKEELRYVKDEENDKQPSENMDQYRGENSMTQYPLLPCLGTGEEMRKAATRMLQQILIDMLVFCEEWLDIDQIYNESHEQWKRCVACPLSDDRRKKEKERDVVCIKPAMMIKIMLL